MRRATRWGPDDIGDLTGRTVIVTGANSGIGFEAAVELAAHGAHVVLACRDATKGQRAADRLVGAAPRTSVEVLPLDLSSQESVRRAAARFAAEHGRLDVLVNNAGVMGTPYQLTEDGFERQFATNHLGPFAFTGLLLDTLLTTPGSRVVTVSSTLHRIGRLELPARLGAPTQAPPEAGAPAPPRPELSARLGAPTQAPPEAGAPAPPRPELSARLGAPTQAPPEAGAPAPPRPDLPARLQGLRGGYNRWFAYGNAKLANLAFTYELDRRLRAAGAGTVAVAAHPGWARTNLVSNGPVMGGSALRARAGALAGHLGQSAAGGALPTLYAATAPGVTGGEYFGPGGLAEQYGPPVRVRSSRRSHRVDEAVRLWEISEELTAVHYDFGHPDGGHDAIDRSDGGHRDLGRAVAGEDEGA